MDQKACWGYLVPCSADCSPVELLKTEVLVGRDAGCDVLLRSSKLGCRQEHISKIHFRLVHGTHGAVLRDNSKTGTYVNGRLVGHGKQAPISHGVRIDIHRPGLKAFVFLDKATSDGTNYPQTIKDKYVMGHQLGEGGFGQVFLVLNKVSLQRYAIKMVKNTKIARREADILCEIRHACMIRAFELFTNPDHLYIVLEYVAGGDLSRWVNDKKLLSEKQTKLLFYQLALAVKYMHDNSITHRDLKPANILLVSNTPHSLIKVTDFGLAKDEELHSNMTTCAGTEVYLAPEVMVSSPYTNKVDIWSLGVILYYSLSGVLPFHSLNDARRLQHHVMFSADKWRFVSLTALELVKRMLVTTPERRAGVKEVLGSLWLQDELMKAEAHTLMGVKVASSPTTPTGKNPPTQQNAPQPARLYASPKAVSPVKAVGVKVVTPARLNPPPANQKAPFHAPQNRQPVTPRGVLQYLTPNSGDDKPKPTVPVHEQVVPNRLRGKSPVVPLKDNPITAKSPLRAGQIGLAIGIKLPPVHKAQKTFLVEARKNLKPAS